MFNIEDQIELYSDPSFNPKAEAQRFFSSNGEAEVTRKLNEMSGVQRNVEEILKKKVRSNYALFLHANEEIHKIGFEITDLKKQIQGTQAIIQNIRQFETGLGEAKAMRHNSLIPKIKEKHKIEREESDKTNAWFEGTDVPSWVVKSPDDIARCIVEQQFQRAVEIVVNVRAYIESTRKGKGNAAIEATVSVVEEQLIVQVDFLTSTILRCMSKLSHSSLWGELEHNRRLKLLITLGCEKLASDSFCSSQADLTRRAIRNLESTGDPLAAASQISASFFTLLVSVSQSFLSLFGDQKSNPAKLGLLLPWAHGQIQAYSTTFASQMHLGAHEASALVFVAMRQAARGGVASPSVQEPSAAVTTTPFQKAPQSADNEDDDELPTVHKDGPLAFIAECIDKAFFHAAKLDAIGFQGVSGLSLFLVPEITMGIRSFSEEIVGEMSSQVRQDVWQGRLPTALAVVSPVKTARVGTNQMQGRSSGGSAGVSGSIDIKQIAGSYDWLTQLLNHYFEEAWILLSPAGDSQTMTTKMTRIPSSLSLSKANPSQNSAGGANPSAPRLTGYTRADICECEPVLVSSILRVLVRYCMELECIDTKSLTQVQWNCFVNTVQASLTYLLPSVENAISSMLYYDFGSDNDKSVKNVMTTLSSRMSRLTKEKSEGSRGSPSK